MSLLGEDARATWQEPPHGNVLVGDLLGQFRVEARIGSGGLGVVYRAYDVKLKRQVALKVLSEGATQVERLLAEARSAAALTHASIAAIYDVQQVGGVAFLVMELVQGRTLRAELDAQPHEQLPVAQAVAIARDIAAAITRAHRCGIVHRDLKPENVVVTRGDGSDGEHVSAKILDFGLARSLDDGPVADGRRVSGTRNYMSPEQAAGGAADARSDVFSFGVVLHEMLAGTRPFEVRSERDTRLWDERAWARGRRLRALVPHVPAALDRLVESCLELDPEKRPAGGADVVEALDAWQRSLAPGPVKRKVTLAALGLAAAGAAAALASMFFVTGPRAHHPVQEHVQAQAPARPTRARPRLEGAGQTWEIVEGEWRTEGEEIVGTSGHLQTTSALGDGLVELDVRAPLEESGVLGIGFRYSLTGDNPRAQCGYGFNIRHSLETASFVGEDGDWAPASGGYRASPAVHEGWNHVVIHMSGPSFTVDVNGARVDAFTNVLFAEGRITLWARASELRVAHVHLIATDDELVERDPRPDESR